MTDPYPYAPQPQPAYVLVQPSTSNGMGIASFVLAMVSMVLSIIPVVNFLDWLLLPLGVLFGFIGLFQHGKSKGLAIAGLILNIIGIVVMVVAGVALVALLASAGSQPR